MTQENKKKFKSGYFVTIAKQCSDFTPAIFWVNDNTVCAYSPELGEFKHRKTPDEIIKHFEKCEQDGFQVLVSGY